jgi:hypothetical protein
MDYLKHIVVEDFFDEFQNIEDAFKKLSLYNQKEYNKKFKDTQTWPGSRSEYLHLSSPFLFNLFNQEFKIKFDNFFKNNRINIASHIHLRTGEDSQKDWIHRDSNACTYSCLVYLSKTNLNSGTYLYSDDEEIISDIKFVQNRAILFDARYLHSAYGHHGSSIEDGRLTLNAFFKINQQI